MASGWGQSFWDWISGSVSWVIDKISKPTRFIANVLSRRWGRVVAVVLLIAVPPLLFAGMASRMVYTLVTMLRTKPDFNAAQGVNTVMSLVSGAFDFVEWVNYAFPVTDVIFIVSMLFACMWSARLVRMVKSTFVG